MPVDPNRLREELRRMRELIQTDPAVLARFDADGNGVIDGDEWEQVRQLVIQRLEREAAESAWGQQVVEAHPDAELDDLPVVVGNVAQEIYAAELPRAQSAPWGGSLLDAPEIIVEERGLGQVLQGIARRNYALLLPDGREVGAIEQRENEMLASFKAGGLTPTLHFDVIDALSGERVTFRRDAEVFGDQVVILDPSGAQLGHIKTKFGLLNPSFKIVSTFSRSSLQVKWRVLRPFTMTVVDSVDDPVGEIQRGWSGLGAFLTGPNRMRIAVNRDEVSRDLTWGLIACAVLAEMGKGASDKDSSVSGLLGGVADITDIFD
jgi:hypothetical protein